MNNEKISKWLLIIISLFTLTVNAKERIIAIGPDVTEIIYQLGAGDKLVGRDMRSIYPEAATQIANIGYMRRLNAEGLLSLRPDLIIASKLAAPSLAFEQIQTLGVPVVFISGEASIQGMTDRVEQIAQTLQLVPQGQRLIAQMQQTLQHIPQHKLPIKVLFIRSFNGNTLLAGGRETLIDSIIQIAGLENALANIKHYQTIAGEGLIAAAPDLIVTTHSAMAHFNNPEQLWQLGRLAETPAGRKQQLLVLDDIALFSFGLQTPMAILDLRNKAEANYK